MRKDRFKQLFGEPQNLEQAKKIIDLLLDTAESQQEQLVALDEQSTNSSRNSSKLPFSDPPEAHQSR